MNNELKPTSPPSDGDLSYTDTLALQLKLMDLLGKQVRRYTSDDSSSVPVEIAQELLSSVCLTLGIESSGDPENLKSLIGLDLDKKFYDGILDLQQKIKIGKRLWQTACLCLTKIQSISLHDTLKSMCGFFRRYDYYYFAHDIPCDIDYQLCQPVPERLLGVDYVNEYLKRIIIENELLNCFSDDTCVRLLETYCPNYGELLINLYEPVATNAIGISLIGGDILKLDISESESQQICELLCPLTENLLIEQLRVLHRVPAIR